VESEGEDKLLTRQEQTTLESALRIAIRKCQERGMDGETYREMLYDANLGLFPEKLGQVYNLLKMFVGFDPLGRDTRPKGEKQPGPTRSQTRRASSLQDLSHRIYDKAKAEKDLFWLEEVE